MENLLLLVALIFIGFVGFIIAKKTNLFIRKDREERILDDIYRK